MILASIRATVVLPAPLSPTTAVTFPASSRTVTASTACTRAFGASGRRPRFTQNDFVRLRPSSTGAGVVTGATPFTAAHPCDRRRAVELRHRPFGPAELGWDDSVASVQPARHLARGPVDGQKTWKLFAALLHRPAAARIEGASLGQVLEIRRRPGDPVHPPGRA